MQSVVIGLVAVILVAALVFFFITTLNPIYKGNIDKNACSQSVALRNNAILRGEGILPETIPLNCKTQEIKISSPDEAFIKREIANSMYDCWDMLGKGEKDFFAKSTWQQFAVPGIGNAESACIICSNIKFEGGAKNKNLDFLPYLRDTNVPSQNISYLNFFTDGADKSVAAGVQVPPLSTNTDYSIIFMGVKGQDYWRALEADAAVLIGTGTVSSMIVGPKVVMKAGLFVIKKFPLATTIVAAGVLGAQAIGTWQSNAYVAEKCNGEWKGCYQIVLMPTSGSNIAALCKNVESIP